MRSTVSIARTRQKVREALKLAGGNPLTEAMIHEAVTELLANGVSLQDTRDAMTWNHEEGHIRSEWLEEAEVTAWFITKRGLAHENIK